MDISKDAGLNLVRIPEKENDFLTAATKLVEKRREIHEMNEAFKCRKEEFQMRITNIQKRKQELQTKELQLTQCLLKFNKFLVENESKKNRGYQKEILERENQRQRSREILELKSTFVSSKEKLDKIKLKLEKYRSYEQYIENVVEISDEFTESREIIDRFSTLTSTYEDLLLRNRNGQMKLIEEKHGIMQINEDKNRKIIQYNNLQGKLQIELEGLQSKYLEKEAEWNSLISEVARKTLTYGRIKMATNNLYVISQKFLGKKIRSTEIVDTFEQLEKTQSFLEDLLYIVNENSITEE